MRQLKPVSWLAVALLVVAGLTPAGTRAANVGLVTVATGFDRPLFVTGAGTNDEQRLFVVEQAGIIRVVDVETGQHSPFIDITEIVNDEANERGLLGLAFHPNYENNGFFYVRLHQSKRRHRHCPLFGINAIRIWPTRKARR